jgi:hypothetical protein
MKRKVYTTERERKTDQIIGFAAFPLVNAALWFVMDRLLVDRVWANVSLLPWIVNGLVLTLAFLFRPQMGIGYVACIGLVCIPIVPGLVCVAACFVAVAVKEPWGPVIGLLVFLGLAAGLFWLYCQVLAAIDRRSRGE